ncbi:MAG: hypothetical protein JWN81_910 [Solirubrobacterales bacterium]|jgi:pSer/pThr/pTyr-binding forkhead associated (FHA) protein|nr:hypothetical protein [Solirubrobacterales bacterium]
MGRLRVTNGPLAGETITVADEIVIGREDVDLAIDDAEVSRRHVVVRRLEGALEVEDLGSSNGTFVDGERIESPTRVGGGAKIRLGSTVLAVEGVLPVDRTRLRDIAHMQSTRVAGSQATGAGDQQEPESADPQVTRAGGIVPDDLQSTRARNVPADLTRARPVQPARSAPVAEPHLPIAEPGRGSAGPRPTSGTAPPSLGVGAFSPPSRRRRRGLASRSWVPVVLSFGTVVLVAIALVVYFAAR